MRQISGKAMVAMMVVIVLFTMTACKRKKPVSDLVETPVQATVDGTTVVNGVQPGPFSGGETTGAAEETLPEGMAGDDETSGIASNAGNNNPSGSTGSQGQNGFAGNQAPTGPAGNHETAGSSGWESEDRLKYPWELGGKQPIEYTWEEYLALSSELKDVFLKSFSDVRDYENWRDNALKIYNEGGDITPPDEDWEEPTQGQPKLDIPWEKLGAKQPSEYAWAEFQALSPELQMAFQNSFASIDAFEAWMQRAQGSGSTEEKKPWEKPGAKKPDQYTWAEYEALTPDQQMAFQNWFTSIDAFEAWMQKVQGNSGSAEPEAPAYPWDASGAKKPDQYTWAEFEALSPDQQMAFQNWFASIDDFEAWMRKAQGDSSAEEKMPWDEPGAKQPDQYTWTEFEALTPSQQMAFQTWFGSVDAFDAWMQQAQGNASAEKMPWDESGAKKPDQYTWAEFEALNPAQQMVFQNWFGSWENFDKWLQANQP